METTVTARIDVSRPAGRRLVRELNNKTCVKVEYPFVGRSEKTYSVDEVFSECYNILSNHYGCDVKKLL